METIYLVTHAIMAICLVGIIVMALPSVTDRAKGPVGSNLVIEVKPKRLTNNSLYSKIAGLLAVFIG